MNEVIKFLNSNAGVINLLFGGIVAVATAVYAILTSTLVSETRRLREAQTEPHIELSFRSRDEITSLIDIVAVNIGAGPAYEVKVRFAANSASEGAKQLLHQLSGFNALSNGIAYLAPRQEMRSYWTDVREHLEEKLSTIISATSTCKSAMGKVYTRHHTLDLSELKGMIRIGTPPLLKISQDLERLQDAVSKIASGWSKPKVHIYTTEDREAERREWEQARTSQQNASASASQQGKPAGDER
jgi:hypothetical protein